MTIAISFLQSLIIVDAVGNNDVIADLQGLLCLSGGGDQVDVEQEEGEEEGPGGGGEHGYSPVITDTRHPPPTLLYVTSLNLNFTGVRRHRGDTNMTILCNNAKIQHSTHTYCHAALTISAICYTC